MRELSIQDIGEDLGIAMRMSPADTFLTEMLGSGAMDRMLHARGHQQEMRPRSRESNAPSSQQLKLADASFSEEDCEDASEPAELLSLPSSSRDASAGGKQKPCEELFH